MPYDQEKYLQELETEKVELLKKLTNYEKEQKIAVGVFKKQEKLISEKEQQLVEKDNLLVNKEEQITKLKTRIHQLAKKQAPVLVSKEISHQEKSIQTSETNSQVLEDELLEKRLENLKDFGAYWEQLQVKTAEIKELKGWINFYQQKIKQLSALPNRNQKLIVILTILLVFTITLLFLK